MELLRLLSSVISLILVAVLLGVSLPSNSTSTVNTAVRREIFESLEFETWWSQGSYDYIDSFIDDWLYAYI